MESPEDHEGAIALTSLYGDVLTRRGKNSHRCRPGDHSAASCIMYPGYRVPGTAPRMASYTGLQSSYLTLLHSHRP